MAFVFYALRESLFEQNHLKTFDNSLLILLLCVWGFRVVNSVVSSAYVMNLIKSELFGRSFMYKRKKKGPNIDPCGTPVLMLSRSEVASGNLMYCFLFER